MSEDLMTIRQMCDAFDVTPRTLRFYEARELIFPQRRGQHRLYDRRDRARLILILRGKRFGFSLEQIRQLLQLYEPGGTNRAQIAATINVGRDRLADHLGRVRRDVVVEVGAGVVVVLVGDGDVDVGTGLAVGVPAEAQFMTGCVVGRPAQDVGTLPETLNDEPVVEPAAWTVIERPGTRVSDLIEPPEV